MTQYPVAMPTDSLVSILEILKTREIVAHKGQFALDVWNLQGYMMGKYLVVDTPTFEAIGHDDAITHLENHVAGTHSLTYMTLMPVVKFCLQQLIDML